MGLYVCVECGDSWLSEERSACGDCGSPLPERDECPGCGSTWWTTVDLGEELFYLISEGLSPARALYYFLSEVHGVSVEDIAAMCGRTSTSVYNVINNAEEELADV